MTLNSSFNCVVAFSTQASRGFQIEYNCQPVFTISRAGETPYRIFKRVHSLLRVRAGEEASHALVLQVRSTVQSKTHTNNQTNITTQDFMQTLSCYESAHQTPPRLLLFCIQSIFPYYYIFISFSLYIYSFFNFRYCGIAYMY